VHAIATWHAKDTHRSDVVCLCPFPLKMRPEALTTTLINRVSLSLFPIYFIAVSSASPNGFCALWFFFLFSVFLYFLCYFLFRSLSLYLLSLSLSHTFFRFPPFLFRSFALLPCAVFPSLTRLYFRLLSLLPENGHIVSNASQSL